MKSGIYAITSTTSGKSYVGSATTITTRWNIHRSYLRRGLHHSRHLQAAWDLYGEADFTFAVLERVAVPDLIPREQVWMDKMDVRNKGYNVSFVAAPNCAGVKRSPEFCAKLSAAKTGKKRGPMSAETKAKLSASLKVAFSNPAIMAKMSAIRTGRKRPASVGMKLSAALKGVPKSDTARARMSAAAVVRVARSRRGESGRFI